MDWVLYETRKVTLKRLRAQFREEEASEDFPDLQKNVLRGYCGFTQCVAGYALQDMGLKPKAFVTHSLPLFYHGHAGLTLEIKTTEGDNIASVI